MNKQADDVRRDVSKAYAEAVTAPAKKGCCGSAPPQKGVAVKLGGYSRDELAALPEEAVVNSFGCGNPVALAGLATGEVVLDLGSGRGNRPSPRCEEGRSAGPRHWRGHDGRDDCQSEREHSGRQAHATSRFARASSRTCRLRATRSTG